MLVSVSYDEIGIPNAVVTTTGTDMKTETEECCRHWRYPHTKRFHVVDEKVPGCFVGFQLPQTLSGKIEFEFKDISPKEVFFVVWNTEQLYSLTFPKEVTVLARKN